MDHLTRMGLRILHRNWRCRYGELDVIAADDATRTVVFVEVKTRTGDGFGGLAHAVTPRKVRRLRRLAGLWLAGSGRALGGGPHRRDRRADRAAPHPGDHAPAGDRLMALGRAFSVAVRGLDGEIVEIEADITSGLPGVHLVGLPDAALQESRDRVRAAVTNCGNSWPMARLTLALSPATLPKMGSVYDIALAAAVLSAQRKKSVGTPGEDGAARRAVAGRPGPAGARGAARGAGRQTRRLAGRRGAGGQPGRGQPGRRHRRSGAFAPWGSCRAG